MKKTLIFSLAALALPIFAQAATITITPSTATVEAGQKVTLALSINPAGTTIAAVKAYVSYPANILAADSFTFASTWVPVPQGGYDQMGGGVVIKTAGYPGGLTNTASFGTITFTTEAPGAATVTVNNDATIAYDTNTVNALSGTQGSATITITGARRTASTQKQSETIGFGSTIQGSSATSSNLVAGAEATTSTSAASTSAAAQAAAAAAARFGAWWQWLLIVLGAIIVVTGGWYFFRPRQ